MIPISAMLRSSASPRFKIEPGNVVFEPTHSPILALSVLLFGQAGTPSEGNNAKPNVLEEIEGKGEARLRYSWSKAFMLSRRDAGDDDAQRWSLTMHHRPPEELYDVHSDPHQLNNLAEAPEHAEVLKSLRERVDAVMKESNDPRLEDRFDYPPWSEPGLSR